MGKTYQSVILNAEVDAVWDAVKDFHKTDWADGVIESCEKIGDKAGTEIGAKRILNGAIHETLVEFDDAGRKLKYQITDGPSPISKNEINNYFGTLRVVPVTEGKGAFVEWYSQWERNDEKVYGFCNPIYAALLGCLKKKFNPVAA